MASVRGAEFRTASLRVFRNVRELTEREKKFLLGEILQVKGLMPLLMNVFYLLRLGPLHGFTLAYFGCLATGLLLGWAMLRGRLLDGTGDVVTQDVGGWIFMPETHWLAVKKAAESVK